MMNDAYRMTGFGRKLRVMLAKMPKEKRPTQKELADRIGVHRNTVRGWLSGRSEPTEDNFRALCDALGIAPEALTERLPPESLSTPCEDEPWEPGDSARMLMKLVGSIWELAPDADTGSLTESAVDAWRGIGRWTPLDQGIWTGYLAGRNAFTRLPGGGAVAGGQGAAPRSA